MSEAVKQDRHMVVDLLRYSLQFFLTPDVDYLEILDWLARNAVAGKRGSTPAEAPSIFERLGIDVYSRTWRESRRVLSEHAV